MSWQRKENDAAPFKSTLRPIISHKALLDGKSGKKVRFLGEFQPKLIGNRWSSL